MSYQHIHLELTEYYASVLSQQSWGAGRTFSTGKKKEEWTRWERIYYSAGVDKKGLWILRASELFRNTYSGSTAQKANENTDCIRKIRTDIIREIYMKLVSSNLSGHIDKSEAKKQGGKLILHNIT